MPVSISTEELREVLDLMPANQNIMLVGRHGIGKSQILTDYFKQKNMKVVALFLGQMSDPGDLIGLPCKDEASGKTTFLPPYWFPTDGQPVVLFLDELNRARPEVLQTIMDLALNRRLAGRDLPEGSRIISAVNDGAEYQLTDLDPALVSRFNIFTFRPSAKEWLLWAAQNGLDQRVIDFIQSDPSMLDDAGNSPEGVVDNGLEKTPDRRAWHKVSDCIANVAELSPIYKKVISGIVGAAATSKFFSFVANHHLISASDVLFKFDKVKDTLMTYKIHQHSAVIDSVFRYLESAVLNDKQTASAKKSLPLFVALLTDNNLTEAMAYFANDFGSKAYPKAVVFIMKNCPEVYKKIMTFIADI